ncbi:TPA: hypothetical protein HA318_05700, partial [Candidatus Micrarchaeota archaeon]|nr:hypothetical protein [Candidatus Micrarchaeota archaeon]
VKKDLVDGRLDDKFGKDVGEGDELVPAAVAPGKTALRCLFREVMKPFRQAGYNYFVEVLTPTYISLQNFQGEAAAAYNVPAAQNAYPRSWITDSSKIEGELGYNPINGDLHGCDDPRINASALLAISTPFRIQPPAKYDDVYDADVLESYAYPVGAHSGVHPIAAVSPLDYQLRVCIWPAQ